MSTKDILFGHTDSNENVKTFGINKDSTKDFSIQKENAGFVVRALTKSLYSSPIIGVTRELLSNAVDSVRKSGDKRIFISTPISERYGEVIDTESVKTKLLKLIKQTEMFDEAEEELFESLYPFNPQKDLVIRDFGTGIDPEIFSDLYTTLFHSTKREDDEAIGYFGLGSKSPFAISDDFTVINYYEGKRYHYIAKLLDSGATLALIGEMPTKEPNGLCVIVPLGVNTTKNHLNIIADYVKYFSDISFIFRDEDSEATFRIKNRIANIVAPTLEEPIKHLPHAAPFEGSFEYSYAMSGCLGNVYYPTSSVIININNAHYDLLAVRNTLRRLTVNSNSPYLKELESEIFSTVIDDFSLSISLDYLLSLDCVTNVVLPPSRDTVTIDYYCDNSGNALEGFVDKYLKDHFLAEVKPISDAFVKAVMNSDVTDLLELAKKKYPHIGVTEDMLYRGEFEFGKIYKRIKERINLKVICSYSLGYESSTAESYGKRVELLESIETDDYSELAKKVSFAEMLYKIDNMKHHLLTLRDDNTVTTSTLQYSHSILEIIHTDCFGTGMNRDNTNFVTCSSSVLSNVESGRVSEYMIDNLFKGGKKYCVIFLPQSNRFNNILENKNLYIKNPQWFGKTKKELIAELKIISSRVIITKDKCREVDTLIQTAETPLSLTSLSDDKREARNELTMWLDKFSKLLSLIQDSETTVSSLKLDKEYFGLMKYVPSFIEIITDVMELRASEIYKLKPLAKDDSGTGTAERAQYKPLEIRSIPVGSYEEIEFLKRQKLDIDRFSHKVNKRLIMSVDPSRDDKEPFLFSLRDIYRNQNLHDSFFDPSKTLFEISKNNDKPRDMTSFIGNSKVTLREYAIKQREDELNILKRKMINCIKFACSEEGHRAVTEMFITNFVDSIYKEATGGIHVPIVRKDSNNNNEKFSTWIASRMNAQNYYGGVSALSIVRGLADSDDFYTSFSMMSKYKIKDKRLRYILLSVPNYLLNHQEVSKDGRDGNYRTLTVNGALGGKGLTLWGEGKFSEVLFSLKNEYIKSGSDVPFLIHSFNELLGCCLFFNNGYQKIDLEAIYKKVAYSIVEVQHKFAKMMLDNNETRGYVLSQIATDMVEEERGRVLNEVLGEASKVKPTKLNRFISNNIEKLVN